MLPMSSSTSHNSHRRKPYAPRQLQRSNSSLLGTIKNIVTAPLSWFASTDDFEQSKGKRRRVAAAPTEPILDQDDSHARKKRMRVHSPPRDDHQFPSAATTGPGYLDPPGFVFNQQQQPQRQYNPISFPSAINRSASVSLPTTTLQDYPSNVHQRSTHSPLRSTALSRTMSIDPPSRPLSRDSAMSSILLPTPRDRDTSTERSMRPSTSTPRDLSMPPLSSRPSFRMRTSMTPQPHQLAREHSEPPTLSTLTLNPVFVRGPPQPAESHNRLHIHPTVPTLGSLVESQRITRSPSRQHSLLFGSNVNIDSKHSVRQQSPAEKALHELDIYKTPLLPTRLRNSTASNAASITATNGVPDLFKSRRTSRLILMQDDKRGGRSGKKDSKKDLVNESKPYAGEGGMKKLLARRKKEVEEDLRYRRNLDQDEDDQEEVDEDAMDDGHRRVSNKVDIKRTSPKPERAPAPAPAPPPPQTDWFSTASASSGASGSSLRVGRTKMSRNHIARPSSRSMTTNRFSASFDDEGDDAMDDGEQDVRDRERKELEEAAKRAPIFSVPAGFSFAKETKPVAQNASDAKEPPIGTLPFSLTASKPPAPNAPTSAFGPSISDPVISVATPAPTKPPAQSTSSAPMPEGEKAPQAKPQLQSAFSFNAPPSTATPAASTSIGGAGGVPNFFATSSAFSKPLEIPTPPLILPSSSPTPSFAFPSVPTMKLVPDSSPAVPVKDAENPFWDGSKPKDGGSAAATSSGLFTGFSENIDTAKANQSTSASGVSTDSGLTSAFGSSAAAPSTAPAFSFSSTTASNQDAPRIASGFGSFQPQQPASSSTTPQPLLFGVKQPTEPTAPAPTNIFGASANESSTKPPALFGGQSAGSSLFPGNSTDNIAEPKAPKSTPSPLSFLGPDAPKPASSPVLGFGQLPSASAIPSAKPTNSLFGGPAPSADAPKPFGAVETPTPIFGTTSAAASGFQFGQPPAAKPEQKPATPFAFGAAPSTPPAAAEKKPAMFSFGTSSPAPSPAPQLGFSFSGGGSATSDVSSKPFAFGSSAPATPIERPITPPNNGEQEFRMEESPTREMQLNGNKPGPMLGGGNGFAFGGNSNAGSIFGGQASAPAASPFSFNSTDTNPFAAASNDNHKPTDNKPFGGFGQSAAPSSSTSGFAFGQNKPTEVEPPRPSTTGSFSFNSTPTSSTGPGTSFAFGGPGNNSTDSLNAFGQPQQAGSAPGSPSVFNNPSPFSFGPPAPAVNTGFSFSNSQPASPAVGNISLPQPATPGGFGGFGGQAAPSSPFGAPAAPAAGGNLFTIGAAPAAAPGAAGAPRVMRKLPNRRTGAKR